MMHTEDESTILDDQQDYLSSLLDDCVIDILAFLDRMDLEQVKSVNRRLYEAASYQIPRCPKIEAYELKITQRPEYHAFQICEPEDGQNFLYFITKGDVPRPMHETKHQYTGECPHRFDRIFDDDKTLEVSLYQPTPSLLYSQLEKLLEMYSPEKITLINIIIDSSFINFLNKWLDRRSINWINAVGIRVEADCVDNISYFLSECDLESLEISRNDDSTLCEIAINETFVRNFARDNKFENDYYLDVICEEEIEDKFRFFPSRSILDVMVCYSYLRLPSLTLETNWIPELFEKRLKIKEEATWVINITRPTQLQQFMMSPHITYEMGREEDVLIDTEEGTQVSFSCVQDTAAGFFLLTAEFSTIQ